MKEQEEKRTGSETQPEQEASANDSKPKESEPSDTKEEDRSKNQKESEPSDPKDPKEDKPKIQQETDKQKKWKDLVSNNPTRIIQECLSVSFSGITYIKDFCFTYFEDLYKELNEGDGRSTIIRRIIQHSYEHDTVDYLWECIRTERINHYEKYHPKWKEAKTLSPDSIGRFVDASESTKRENPLAPDSEANAHPLAADDRAAINNWFHDELGPQERSMVLTIALFEGINRKYMISISEEIQRRMFDAKFPPG